MSTSVIPPERDDTSALYVVADATGKIVLSGSVPAFMLATQIVPTGASLVLGTGSLTDDYVLNGAVTPRPANPTTQSGMKLLNVPNPSTVTIAGVNPQVVTDGEVDLVFTQPGIYSVSISSWPALDATFTVTQP